MLYREIISVCSQIHAKHINTLGGQNVEFPMTAGIWKGSYFEIRYDVRQYEVRRNAPVTVL